MDLSLTEAADLLGCSPRTLRDRLRRGELRGHKRDGRWHVSRAELLLTDAQRRALDERTALVRGAVEDVLGRTPKSPKRSIVVRPN